MSPTMVFHNSVESPNESGNQMRRKLFLVLGASGGPRIITAVVQVIINFMVFGMCLKDAVAHPRVHDQLLYNGIPSTLFDKNVTEAGFEVSEITQQSLLRRGHNLVPTTYLGTCQAVSVDIETDALEAVSDVRKGGIPAGY
jgi:gamma-glutamyltranspeptidase